MKIISTEEYYDHIIEENKELISKLESVNMETTLGELFEIIENRELLIVVEELFSGLNVINLNNTQVNELSW